MSIFRAINSDAKYGAVSVGTTAVELKVGTDIIPGRTELMVANAEDTAGLFIGTDDSVTASNGFPVPAGEHVFLKLVPGQKVFAISDGEASDVRII